MRTIAFYLPQFHEIPENDEWWGQGFTDWTNVRRARPQFEGHPHPRVPTVLGEYDLTDPTVYRAQSAMARANGVDAFCMYFYWFDGRRLLDRPVEAWRQDPGLLPYCLSWANESWTRRWDGKARHVLMPQTYGGDFARELFRDLLPHFEAPHYLRQDGLPVLLVHRADLIPDAPAFVATLEELAAGSGLPGLHLVAAETRAGLEPASIEFDAVAEFPPVGANTLAAAHTSPLRSVERTFKGRLMSYERIARRFESRQVPPFTRYRGVMPSWDNTARRMEKATVYLGATPDRYGQWLAHAREAEAADRGDAGLVFINAWNEWAEGAYLEPDELHGDAYLRATRAPSVPAAPAVPSARGSHEPTSSGRRRGLASSWSWPQVRSLLLATFGSGLSWARQLRATLRRRWRL